MPLSLEGAWDVSITESSTAGTTKHNITMIVEGGSAKYIAADDESHYRNGAWSDLAIGHTSSGKSFVAKQRMSCAPSWLGRASVLGPSGLRGRLSGPNSAKFATSMTILDQRGDNELEIEQVGEMTRR